MTHHTSPTDFFQAAPTQKAGRVQHRFDVDSVLGFLLCQQRHTACGGGKRARHQMPSSEPVSPGRVLFHLLSELGVFSSPLTRIGKQRELRVVGRVCTSAVRLVASSLSDASSCATQTGDWFTRATPFCEHSKIFICNLYVIKSASVKCDCFETAVVLHAYMSQIPSIVQQSPFQQCCKTGLCKGMSLRNVGVAFWWRAPEDVCRS